MRFLEEICQGGYLELDFLTLGGGYKLSDAGVLLLLFPLLLLLLL